MPKPTQWILAMALLQMPEGLAIDRDIGLTNRELYDKMCYFPDLAQEPRSGLSIPDPPRFP
jgi:hypothetical protein